MFSCLAELCGPAGKVYLEASMEKGWTAGTFRLYDAGSMWATSEAKPGNLGLSWKKNPLVLQGAKSADGEQRL